MQEIAVMVRVLKILEQLKIGFARPDADKQIPLRVAGEPRVVMHDTDFGIEFEDLYWFVDVGQQPIFD